MLNRLGKTWQAGRCVMYFITFISPFVLGFLLLAYIFREEDKYSFVYYWLYII